MNKDDEMKRLDLGVVCAVSLASTGIDSFSIVCGWVGVPMSEQQAMARAESRRQAILQPRPEREAEQERPLECMALLLKSRRCCSTSLRHLVPSYERFQISAADRGVLRTTHDKRTASEDTFQQLLRSRCKGKDGIDALLKMCHRSMSSALCLARSTDGLEALESGEIENGCECKQGRKLWVFRSVAVSTISYHWSGCPAIVLIGLIGVYAPGFIHHPPTQLYR